MLRIEYDGSSKVIRRLCQMVNELFDHADTCEEKSRITDNQVKLLIAAVFDSVDLDYLVDSDGNQLIGSDGEELYAMSVSRKES
jgi:hypothetical protein